MSTLQTLADSLTGRHWKLLLDGGLTEARSGATYEVDNPADGSHVGTAADGAEADVDLAVEAAQRAFEGWGSTAPAQRGEVMLAMADAIERHAEELAVLDTLSFGAPISEMRTDVARAVTAMRYFAGLAREVKGETIPASAENFHFTTRDPFGVVARIIPFNHPAMFAITKISAPLIAGNCVLLKPPELACLSALRMGEILADVVPPGVLNIVVGNGPAVPRHMVTHQAVTRIGFTGSETVGRQIQQDAASSGVKSVTLELGGKNALIAFPDADPAAVAAGAVRGMNFTWAGQSCGSTSRVLVHRSLVDDVVGHIVERLEQIEYLPPLDPACSVGPLASRAQFEKTRNYIRIAEEEGAKVAAGGSPPPNAGEGFYMRPTVLTGVRPDMRIAQEEVFGPVMSVLAFDEEDEAIDVANGVTYGLTASIWTNDLKRAHRVARAMKVGFVWINGSSQHFLGVPFGGVKGSGVGREESFEEVVSYTQTKSVNVMLG